MMVSRIFNADFSLAFFHLLPDWFAVIKLKKDHTSNVREKGQEKGIYQSKGMCVKLQTQQILAKFLTLPKVPKLLLCRIIRSKSL